MTSTEVREDRGVVAWTVAALLALDVLVDMPALPTVHAAHMSRPAGDPEGTPEVLLQLQPTSGEAEAHALTAQWGRALQGAGIRVHGEVRACGPDLVRVSTRGVVRGTPVEVWTAFPRSGR